MSEPYLPRQGGNIVLLTQLWWPQVHPYLQEERKKMAKFVGRRGDLTWGPHDYPVTKSQKVTLQGIRYMMEGLPKVKNPVTEEMMPVGYFCSQRPSDGGVVIGLVHHSVTVDRHGRVKGNTTPFPPRGFTSR